MRFEYSNDNEKPETIFHNLTPKGKTESSHGDTGHRNEQRDWNVSSRCPS